MGAAVTEEEEEDGLLVAAVAGAGPGAPFAVVAALLAQGQRRLKEEGEEHRLLEAPLEGGAVRGAQAAAAGTHISLSISYDTYSNH